MKGGRRQPQTLWLRDDTVVTALSSSNFCSMESWCLIVELLTKYFMMVQHHFLRANTSGDRQVPKLWGFLWYMHVGVRWCKPRDGRLFQSCSSLYLFRNWKQTIFVHFKEVAETLLSQTWANKVLWLGIQCISLLQQSIHGWSPFK